MFVRTCVDFYISITDCIISVTATFFCIHKFAVRETFSFYLSLVLLSALFLDILCLVFCVHFTDIIAS